MLHPLDQLYEDFKVFKNHSWYKHIPLAGRDYYVYLEDGHWVFSGWIPEEADYETVRFGPFLRGIEGSGEYRYTRGFHIVAECDEFQPWIEKNYPHLAHIDWSASNMYYDLRGEEPKATEEIYQKETARYWHDLVHAANRILSRIQP